MYRRFLLSLSALSLLQLTYPSQNDPPSFPSIRYSYRPVSPDTTLPRGLCYYLLLFYYTIINNYY